MLFDIMPTARAFRISPTNSTCFANATVKQNNRSGSTSLNFV